MVRVLCFAQMHAAARQPRAAAKGGKVAGKAAAAAKPASFTMLERVPVRLTAHTPVWAALRKHGTRQPIVDAEHPQDSFPAHVVAIEALGADAVAAVAEVLAERRALMLAGEKGGGPADILGRPLDKLFEQEMEWLAIRNLLAAALAGAGTPPRGRKKKPARALLLIDA